jgi:hypothetical protein
MSGVLPSSVDSSGSAQRPGFDERQQIGVDQVCVRGRHAVRQSRIGFKRPVL